MRIKKIRLIDFKRFKDLTIENLGEDAKLVILAGPNGCGKSSLFDAFSWSHYSNAGLGWDGMWDYYLRPGCTNTDLDRRILIDFHGEARVRTKSDFYFRSAYRQEADFTLKTLQKVGEPTDEEKQIRKMMSTDASVSKNYQRLASQALVDAFAEEKETMTLAQFREKVIGELKRSVKKLFPLLDLNSLGNPLEEGTFRFDKESSRGFKYKNLSGGEKAAFDIILDIVVKRRAYEDAIYCIDEPELHMNTRLQGHLLETILEVIPPSSQLWISTHSIGMMRKAQQLWRADPDSVVFLDFGSIEPDNDAIVRPSRPTRVFWERILSVALDDLAELMTPEKVIICEGNPAGSIAGKNSEFDALCYDCIFSDEYPEVKFVSGGNSSSVAADRLAFARTIPLIARGVTVGRLIDRDDHGPRDIADFESKGVSVLSRRQIESFLYDDEVLAKLCDSVGQPQKLPDIIKAKEKGIADSIARGNPADDLKSASGEIYVAAKKILQLISVGNDPQSFAKNMLAPLVRETETAYAELRKAVFGH